MSVPRCTDCKKEKKWEGHLSRKSVSWRRRTAGHAELRSNHSLKKIIRLSGRPLLAVGSGGSLTTATIAAGLFRDFGWGFSSAITPLELSARRGSMRGTSALVATAGGSNADVVGALRVAAKGEAAHVLALCASVGSRLADESAKFSNVSIEEFESPSGRDGFLAANPSVPTTIWRAPLSHLVLQHSCLVYGCRLRIP